MDTMDKFRELSASLKANADELRRDGVYGCCAGTYRHAAAHIDAIVRESEAQVPVAATLDEAAADPALTLDVARELLRDAAAGIRSLAASAERTEPAEGREACPRDCGCVVHCRREQLQASASSPDGDGVALDAGHGKALGEMMARIFGSGDKPLTEQESREIQALHAAQIALTSKPNAGETARVTEADRELRKRAGQMILRLRQFALIQRRRRYPKNAELAAECAELLAALAAREGGAS